APRTSKPPGRDQARAAASCATSPRLERALTHRGVLPSAPGPCRLPAPGQLQAAREEEGELGAGGATLADPARGSGASARGLSKRAGERAPGSSRRRRRRSKAAPHRHPERGSLARALAERGPPGGRLRNGSSPGKGRQVALGSSFLRKEVGNGQSERGSQPYGKDTDSRARAGRRLSDQKGCVLDPAWSHPRHLERGKLLTFSRIF
ncbi:unnamed protein product, partial [Rangifer tarandus platyrhynchus]